MLHRWLIFLSFTALLYGGWAAAASGAQAGIANAAPPETAAAAHIALLLPLDSRLFGAAAAAVEQGFMAAAQAQAGSPPPIRVYRAGNDASDILSRYREALAAGTRVVVGPLTHDSVSALSTSGLVAVPTLALNDPENGVPLPPNLYTLSLSAEAEARQIARFAIEDGHRSAITIVGRAPLLQRMSRAFVDEFTRLGASRIMQYPMSNDAENLRRIGEAARLGVADMAFLALGFREASIVRPYLDALTAYATSQVYPGAATPLASFDLGGVRFADMPWLLEPDHPAVMIYPRSDFQAAPELERLYALGIDAFRIASGLARGEFTRDLDGVTGRITLGRDHRFARELIRAEFSGGKLAVFSDTR